VFSDWPKVVEACWMKLAKRCLVSVIFSGIAFSFIPQADSYLSYSYFIFSTDFTLCFPGQKHVIQALFISTYTI